MRITIFIFRSLCAMLVGFLLVSHPETMSPLLVQIIGGLFAAMGLFSLISHWVNRWRYDRARRRAEAEGVAFIGVQAFSPATPVVALGSVAFGTVLILFPAAFVTVLMYALGALLIAMGLAQGVALVSARVVAPLGWSLLLLPALLIAAGVWVVLRPTEAASLPFVVLGTAFILYGVAEFCFGIRYRHYQRIYEREMAASEMGQTDEVGFVEAVEVTDEAALPQDLQDPQ
ncbi:MAG: DUF308 domain-containing protein [Bacteroidaceae bacterium]|nr:DUF308 domain-containing protein [Bacteroidaceae bacterium]